ncbi:hypothetical protein KFK09_008567 [Dendrobium nobile]|uniref:TF-B3 domain-containing protein n=1 Tax=Dendrobium nobile TaxID=94219 RepID=A0A8T3BN35_DENNO|nr:hypothetical protein KFK09_008567 [Dendrobium nobile]
MDVLTRHLQEDVPWCMLFADDILLVDKTREGVEGVDTKRRPEPNESAPCHPYYVPRLGIARYWMTWLHLIGLRTTIPIAFAIQYLPRASDRVLLQLNVKERTWPVHCLVQGNSFGFSSRWKEFAQYNQLNVGDVCIFEMLEAQEGVLMAVHISRIK